MGAYKMKYSIVYTDFLSMWTKVINPIASCKETRIKNNTQNWFDKEIAELTHAKFKKIKTLCQSENLEKQVPSIKPY